MAAQGFANGDLAGMLLGALLQAPLRIDGIADDGEFHFVRRTDVAYFGYHVRATEHLTGDLVYRSAFYDYRDAGTGRGDNNHSPSLSLRYEVTEWLALSATARATWNQSNQSVFDYEALNLGGSFGLNARF